MVSLPEVVLSWASTSAPGHRWHWACPVRWVGWARCCWECAAVPGAAVPSVWHENQAAWKDPPQCLRAYASAPSEERYALWCLRLVPPARWWSSGLGWCAWAWACCCCWWAPPKSRWGRSCRSCSPLAGTAWMWGLRGSLFRWCYRTRDNWRRQNRLWPSPVLLEARVIPSWTCGREIRWAVRKDKRGMSPKSGSALIHQTGERGEWIEMVKVGERTCSVQSVSYKYGKTVI